MWIQVKYGTLAKMQRTDFCTQRTRWRMIGDSAGPSDNDLLLSLPILWNFIRSPGRRTSIEWSLYGSQVIYICTDHVSIEVMGPRAKLLESGIQRGTLRGVHGTRATWRTSYANSARNICVTYAPDSRRMRVTSDPRIRCKCCVHLPRATRDVTFGPLCLMILGQGCTCL
jgi:hypothetical protein